MHCICYIVLHIMHQLQIEKHFIHLAMQNELYITGHYALQILDVHCALLFYTLCYENQNATVFPNCNTKCTNSYLVAFPHCIVVCTCAQIHI